MSLHKHPKYQIPALNQALKDHGLEHDKPSQLSDSFRTGWTAALAHTGQATPAGAQGAEGRVHDLKCWTSYYRDVASGKKPFEVRVNDRDYRVGDWLRLRDWNVEAESYSGHECRRQVTYVLTASEFVKEGMAILGLATPATEPAAPGYVSAPSPAEDKDGARYRWLRANREAQAADGTIRDVYDEDGTMLWHDSLDAAIDWALAQEGAKE